MKTSQKYIAYKVFFQWLALISNVCLLYFISRSLQNFYIGKFNKERIVIEITLVVICIGLRFCSIILANKMGYYSSEYVKVTLREKIYSKLLRLGSSYKENLKTSELVQIVVEGVGQLEIYFSDYLPQFFYAILASLTLFIIFSFIDLKVAIILFLCVPLIPITIMLIAKFAKKLLAKYWVKYAKLGDTFLENLQGLTTSKIYQADEFKHREMNQDSEEFRIITMKVLYMQLNSITVMDVIAYGGAALGIIMAINQYKIGNIDLQSCIFIIILSAEFFLPMRLLGSYFHIAMNGMAASDKIFYILDLPEGEKKTKTVSNNLNITIENLHFRYSQEREILKGINMIIPNKSFTAIVGESGSGKSTIAGILMKRNRNYKGNIKIGQEELTEICEKNLLEKITYVGHESHMFKGTIRQNLLYGRKGASDNELWSVLDRVNLSDFLKTENGLDTFLKENASNLSGGQIQRLALARALLHDSELYIFDEASSNIDVESENEIMRQIHSLAREKTVILISHRLANVVLADNIYVMENGHMVEEGCHKELLEKNNVYAKLWKAQQELETYTGESYEKKWC